MKYLITFLIVLSIIFTDYISSIAQYENKNKKKDQVQWEVPEFRNVLDLVYHPGRDRYYISDGRYGYPFANKQKKGDKVQASQGIIYEVHPLDFNNRIALPIDDIADPYPIVLIGDSLYIYDDLNYILGYDLNTSTTFTKIYFDSLNIEPFYDAVTVGKDIYYTGTSNTMEFDNKFVKFDTQTETFEILDLPVDHTVNATGMHYNEITNQIYFVSMFDSISIKAYDIGSSTITDLKSTDISWMYYIEADTSGNIYLQNNDLIREHNPKLWIIDENFQNEPQLFFDTSKIIDKIFFEKKTNSLLAFDSKIIIILKLLQHPPELLYPENGATNIETQPAFDWVINNNAENYEFQLSTNSNFSTLFYEKELAKENFVNSKFDDTLENNTTYYWRVKAKNENLESPWSESRTFTTSELSKPLITLVFPPNDTTFEGSSMTFTWNSLPGADEYLIRCNGKYEIHDVTATTSDTSIVIENLFFENFTWSVKASKGSGSCDWSASRSFLVELMDLDVINYLTPAYDDQAGTPTGVEFTWYPKEFAPKYELRIAPVRDEFTNWWDYWDYFETDSNSIYIDSLDLRTTYQWEVRGVNGTKKGRWNQQGLITAYYEVPQPELIFPNENDPNIKGKPKLTWNDMSADSYDVYIYEKIGWDFSDLKEHIEHGHYLPPYLIDPFIKAESINGTEYYIKDTLKDKTLYLWRVRTINNGDYSKWSDVRAFKTNFSTPVEDNPSNENDFNIYPNPAASNATAEFYLTKPGIVEIRVYNIYGSLVNEYPLGYITEGNQMYVMNLEGTVSGMYYVVINIGGEKKLAKMVKY